MARLGERPTSSKKAPRPKAGAELCILEGVVRRNLILLYEAAATGGFQVRAQFRGLIHRGEWTHHRPKEDAMGAEVEAADDRRTAAEQVRIFGLQVVERGLRFLFATLRRNLNGIAAASRRQRCLRHSSPTGDQPRGC